MAPIRRDALQHMTAMMCASGFCEVRVVNDPVIWFSAFSAAQNQSMARKASTSCLGLKRGTSTPEDGFAAPWSARREVI
jgi:hypothetical protein